jgi:phospholipid/cholesterol/gamma-HCH transport system substrate-binding protein
MILQDQGLATQIRQVVANVHQATGDLNHASHQADALISDFQSRHLPPKADDTMGVVKDAASNIDEGAQTLQLTIAEAVGADRNGVTASANISQSLSNVNTATANMADDTEALKHNFLFRGFFHHRGYYNLDHINPDQYSKNHVFTDPANYRAWLLAIDLFKKDDKGVESLSSEGEKKLKAAIAQYGESVVQQAYRDRRIFDCQRPSGSNLDVSSSRLSLGEHFVRRSANWRESTNVADKQTPHFHEFTFGLQIAFVQAVYDLQNRSGC